jgi:hypothetical protein
VVALAFAAMCRREYTRDYLPGLLSRGLGRRVATLLGSNAQHRLHVATIPATAPSHSASPSCVPGIDLNQSVGLWVKP